MKPLALSALLAALVPLAAGCGTVQESKVKASSTANVAQDDDEDEDADESEEQVSLDAVPAAVLAAARAAVPGITLSSAEREVEHGQAHYCVHGTAAGELVEVEVSPSGDVLEIERGDDGEDD